MKIIKPNAELLWITPNAEKIIELAGRTCYKSESKITENSTKKFIKMIIKRGHESVLEHGVACIKFICDRGVTHELVRHRLASYSQESTRYCNYRGGVTFIEPCFWNEVDIKYEFGKSAECYSIWKKTIEHAEKQYIKLIEAGATPQEARSVLPNSLKTEIVCTANFREWRHIFKLRTSKRAHPQIREVMGIAHKKLQNQCPVIFEKIT